MNRAIETFFSVRVQRTDRQKPSNVVVQALSPEVAEQAARAAYGDRIGHIKSVRSVDRATVFSQIGEYGDLRNDGGAILTDNADPRYPALGTGHFVFAVKFKDSAAFGYLQDQTIDTHIAISANSEDAAWAIYGLMMKGLGIGVERVLDTTYVGDLQSLGAFVTVDRNLQQNFRNSVQSYCETPPKAAEGSNFRTFCTLAQAMMSWDKAAEFWQAHFDDRLNGDVEAVLEPEPTIRVKTVMAILSEALAKGGEGDVSSDIRSYVTYLQARIRNEVRAA